MAIKSGELTVAIKCVDNFGHALKTTMQQLSEFINKWAPTIIPIHRADVRAVHTAYRRKKGRRW